VLPTRRSPGEPWWPRRRPSARLPERLCAAPAARAGVEVAEHPRSLRCGQHRDPMRLCVASSRHGLRGLACYDHFLGDGRTSHRRADAAVILCIHQQAIVPLKFVHRTFDWQRSVGAC